MLKKEYPANTDNFKEVRHYLASVLHVAITPQQYFHKKAIMSGS